MSLVATKFLTVAITTTAEGKRAETLYLMTLRRNREVDHSELRKRSQIGQIIDYLEYGEERTKFPDRRTTFIGRHPFMTQFFSRYAR